MPAFSTTIFINDVIPVQHPDESRIRDTAAWKRANSIFCPLGPMATRAHFLLRKSDLDNLTSPGASVSTSEPHKITWLEFFRSDDFSSGPGTENRYEFQGLYLVKSQRLFDGGPDDPNALHLVEFCDARGIAAAHSDTASINYNVRSYADDDDYLDGTEGETWITLTTALWNACPGLGAFPGLPYAPDGVPEDARFIGQNAWHSLCNVLDKLDCAIAHHPLTNTYSIARLGAEQDIAESANRLKWNAEPQDFPATDIPETVRVYFNNHYKSYGQERDTELSTNWSHVGAGAYVDEATGDAGAVTGTVKTLWDDLYRVLDEDNVLSNGTEVSARATERKNNWLQRQQTTRRHKIFIGLNNFICGGQIRAVLWRSFGDQHSNGLGGTVTEYVSRPELVQGFGGQGGGESVPLPWMHFENDKSRENYSPIDLARHSYPNYPRLPNIVQVSNTGETSGDLIDANVDGFHIGKVRRWVANDLVILEDCWIRFVERQDGDVPAINGANYGPARLSGMSTSEGQRLPVYTVRRGAILVFIEFTLTANMTTGSAAATIDRWWGTDEPPSPTTVYDRQGLFKRALTDAKGIAVLDTELDQFVVLECQSKAGWIWVTLTEDMASLVASGTTVDDYKGTQQDVQDPGSTIALQGITGISDNLKAGDKVVALYSSEDDLYYALAKPQVPMWGRTQSAWEENGGDPLVSVKLVTGVPPRTSATVTGDAFDVYLPRANDGDPNVISGVNICWMYDNNGDAVCLTDYMDDPIGTTVFAIDSTRAGWGRQDSTNNSSGSGGSGYDSRDRFLLHLGTNFPTLGDTGGENPHDHFIACFTGFTTDGDVTNAPESTAEFYSLLGEDFGTSDLIYIGSGDQDNISGTNPAVYTAEEMPAYLVLYVLERLDNASD